MKKQLIFYVNKILSDGGDVLFRITNNQDAPNIWAKWDVKRNEPENTEKLFYHMRNTLGDLSKHSIFKMQFESEPCFFGSNPYANNKQDEKLYLDQHLTISGVEIKFWRKLMLDLCVEKL